MNKLFHVDGATRIYPIIGDPIAQVKSPAGMTAAFSERDRNAVVIPVHVPGGDVDEIIRACGKIRNIDGIIVTIPHKFAALAHCATATERARIVGSVNVLRRNGDGGWHGENCDGAGMLGGISARGGDPAGKRAMLVGAGGAGMAIAQALLDAGVSDLAVHDRDESRRDALVARMRQHYGDTARAGTDDPTGFDLVVNATPMGMRTDDPYPVQVERMSPDAFAACAITAPAVSPWMRAARAKGCRGSVGIDMYEAVQALMIDFFLGADDESR